MGTCGSAAAGGEPRRRRNVYSVEERQYRSPASSRTASPSPIPRTASIDKFFYQPSTESGRRPIGCSHDHDDCCDEFTCGDARTKKQLPKVVRFSGERRVIGADRRNRHMPGGGRVGPYRAHRMQVAQPQTYREQMAQPQRSDRGNQARQAPTAYRPFQEFRNQRPKPCSPGGTCAVRPPSRHSLREEIEGMIATQKVLVFSKTTCPFCDRTKKTLQQFQIPFKAVELDFRSDCSEAQDILKDITGARTVPRVFINGRCVGGNDDTQALARSGRLHAAVWGNRRR